MRPNTKTNKQALQPHQPNHGNSFGGP
jgi:hypothetical protein